MSLHRLNNADRDGATRSFMQCCTSERWVAEMVASRPYSDFNMLRETADRIWDKLTEEDYLQAFDGHPKIGDVNSLKAKYANTKQLASGEQSGVNSATDELIQALAKSNRAYEQKYGFIFIVCATGKSAREILDMLSLRLQNERHQELSTACEEQRKIFHIRLEKLL
jgi:2-oxo-4-hydroxy-4-carboxy-5-ureidoimidazoline decarboxylase